jgi:hypothetical protein
MSIIDAFSAASDTAMREHPELAEPALLASRLSWAAAAVLNAAGAGLTLSVGDGLRIPLGSSGEPAAQAERLQFTTGEGPCLESEATDEPVMATEGVLLHTWPVFAGRLLDETPFRSIFAAPVPGIGAMDLYFNDPAGCLTVSVEDAILVAREVSRALADPELSTAIEAEVSTGFAGGRHQVNVALGMIAESTGVSFSDALAMLRAHAFSADTTLEDLAVAVVDGSVPPTRLMP